MIFGPCYNQHVPNKFHLTDVKLLFFQLSLWVRLCESMNQFVKILLMVHSAGFTHIGQFTGHKEYYSACENTYMASVEEFCQVWETLAWRWKIFNENCINTNWGRGFEH